MAALLRSLLWSLLAFVATGLLIANVPGSALVPTARNFDYDGTALTDLRLRQSSGQDNCCRLRPSGGIRSTALLRGGFLSHPAVKFTSKERDAETGLDYFGARYYSSPQGRCTTPDWPFADQFPHDPQSWNLYAYGRNNPLRYIDGTSVVSRN